MQQVAAVVGVPSPSRTGGARYYGSRYGIPRYNNCKTEMEMVRRCCCGKSSVGRGHVLAHGLPVPTGSRNYCGQHRHHPRWPSLQQHRHEELAYTARHRGSEICSAGERLREIAILTDPHLACCNTAHLTCGQA